MVTAARPDLFRGQFYRVYVLVGTPAIMIGDDSRDRLQRVLFKSPRRARKRAIVGDKPSWGSATGRCPALVASFVIGGHQ